MKSRRCGPCDEYSFYFLDSIRSMAIETDDVNAAGGKGWPGAPRHEDEMNMSPTETAIEDVYELYLAYMGARRQATGKSGNVLDGDAFRRRWLELDDDTRAHSLARFKQNYGQLLEEERRQVAEAVQAMAGER